MNKKTILVVVILALLFHTYQITHRNINVVPLPTPIVEPIIIEPDEQTVIDSIKKEDLHKYVSTLSSAEFYGRGTGSDGNTKAALYIKKYLDSLNIPYKEQFFTARGYKTSNIIGYIQGSNSKSNKCIVIGAHYDHLGGDNKNYYPGADDNASGVAGVMSIASALQKYKNKLNHTVLVQFYSAEEIGLLGSKYYVNNPLFPLDQPEIENHIAMINLDMIGYLNKDYAINYNTTTYRQDKKCIIFDYSNSVALKDIVKNLTSKYSFADNIAGYRPGGSDHAPFYNEGIPVVFLHTGLHQHYHKATDTPDRLNYDGMTKVSRLALEIILSIDKQSQ